MNRNLWQRIALCLLLSLTLSGLATWGSAPSSAAAPGLSGKTHLVPERLAATETINLAGMLNFTAIVAGSFHTCVLVSGGGAKCWGANWSGQVGDGTTNDRSMPVDVIGLASGVSAITAGGRHTCALVSTGGVKCWGLNWSGELGDGTNDDRSTPVDVIGLGGVATAIAAGGEFTCALISGGGVKCWGSNSTGQLGDGTTNYSSTPVDVVGLGDDVTAIAAGASHACALSSSGGVKCWGENWEGQLGDGTTDNSSTPVNVVGLANNVIAIYAGGYHTCALISGGGTKCWGTNINGELGDGTTNNRSAPVDVVGLTSDVSAIAVGGFYTCALTSSGGVKCWGENLDGQLGDGSSDNRTTPVDVIGLASGVTAIAAGFNHTCALVSGGGMKCWGANHCGQAGDGRICRRATPVDVIGLTSSVISMTAGSYHTCALVSGGGVKCWGEKGDARFQPDNSTPEYVVGLTSGVIAITAGINHTCALVVGGGVKCWGNNWYGQLGDGTRENRSTPVDVVGLTSGVIAIAANGYSTCALVSGGGVKCWGDNTEAKLGDGTWSNRSTPVDVIGLRSGVTAIAAGGIHNCALLSGGGIKCWGYNACGQLGSGAFYDHSSIPVDVVGLAGEASAIVAGAYHTCALVSGGGAKCWGANWSGQVGDGTTNDRSMPVDVIGLPSGVSAITANGDHTCALVSTGGAKCWGSNWYGQVGDGTTNDRSMPVNVTGLAGGATAIAAGGNHTCALVGNGRPKCWGNDFSNQLGLGAILRHRTPVDVTASLSLTVNYPNGQPGSFFTITGWNYPQVTQATVLVNGQALNTNLAVSPAGSFILFLKSPSVDLGSYTVTVSGNQGSENLSASTHFVLDNSAPLRPQEGGGQTFVVPAGIEIYLPLVKR